MGNDAFEGFGVELIQEIAKFLSKIKRHLNLNMLIQHHTAMFQNLTTLLNGWMTEPTDPRMRIPVLGTGCWGRCWRM